tara:strand:- start:579 stop:722 length:144 start_codon:yes stop_codon:yes gene_type:complete
LGGIGVRVIKLPKGKEEEKITMPASRGSSVGFFSPKKLGKKQLPKQC